MSLVRRAVGQEPREQLIAQPRRCDTGRHQRFAQLSTCVAGAQPIQIMRCGPGHRSGQAGLTKHRATRGPGRGGGTRQFIHRCHAVSSPAIWSNALAADATPWRRRHNHCRVRFSPVPGTRLVLECAREPSRRATSVFAHIPWSKRSRARVERASGLRGGGRGLRQDGAAGQGQAGQHTVSVGEDKVVAGLIKDPVDREGPSRGRVEEQVPGQGRSVPPSPRPKRASHAHWLAGW